MTTGTGADASDDPDENTDTVTDTTGTDEGLTYSEAGVDIEQSEAATAALIEAVGKTAGDYAGLLDIGDRYLALATDGVGTKLLVAEALSEFSTIGIDCIAMNVNDLVAAGVRPAAFVDYLAVESPDDVMAAAIGEGLATGAERAGIELVGGETAVLPEVITGFDLAGACVGLAAKDAIFEGTAEIGDALVGWRSSGIHSNGLTLARTVATLDGGSYTDPCPFEGYETIGDALLEPTRIYTHLLDPLREADVRAAAHVTGGGWGNLERLGDCRYAIESPFEPQPIFEFIQDRGDVSDAEMHRTFNMGTGFVAAVGADRADRLAEETDGRVIGRVESGEGVAVRGMVL